MNRHTAVGNGGKQWVSAGSISTLKVRSDSINYQMGVKFTIVNMIVAASLAV